MIKHCFSKYQKFLFLILLSFTSMVTFGQGSYSTTNWKYNNPKQFGFTIFDVDYFDNNTAIAVGAGGGIAKSTDGGLNWTYGAFTYITSTGIKVAPTFLDVHFVTSSIAYAVGNYSPGGNSQGVLAKTTDAGVTWDVVPNPLYNGKKGINTLWFLNKDTGYIAGQFNTPDSLAKLYFTRNGGSTWDSVASPASNGKTRVGYIANALIPSVLYNIDAKAKDIFRIEFLNDSIGYVIGGGNPLFPAISPRATSATVCTPLTTFLTTGSHNASLVWKFNKGVLTDYSLSKERLGYPGLPALPPFTCTSAYGSITATVQQYRAMNILNDSTLLMMSFNNNIVVKVHTGKNDSTQNINIPGIYEKGKYDVLNNQNPPFGYPPIPAVATLFASNPYNMRRAGNGKIYTGTTGNAFSATPGYLWTSTDAGVTWRSENVYPQGQNYNNFVGSMAIDFAPNGKLLAMGTNGVVGDSVPGGIWRSNYSTLPLSASYSDMEFADCNNGIAAGGGGLTITTDGGATWVERSIPAVINNFGNITSVTYPAPNKVFFSTTIGSVYRSTNQGVSNTPIFGEAGSRLNDLARVGIGAVDSLWVCGSYDVFPVPTASRYGAIYRSFNSGVTWDTVKVGLIGSLYTRFNGIEFPSRTVGYIAGTKGEVYKTIDAGAIWTNISPFASANLTTTYVDVFSLDVNTVFLVGNYFDNVLQQGVKRVYKTTDGGATWTSIAGTLDVLLPNANLSGINMHDVNNGYAYTGSSLFITNNSGATWTQDIAPISAGGLTVTAFAPKIVPAGITMQNRKLFVCGVNSANMLEYGNPANINVNSTETITGGCNIGASGSIVINATGGLAPYTYSLNGGPFQTSNTFSGLTSGNKTITIKDAFCGSLTKTVVIDVKASPAISAGPDKTIVDGDVITLDGSGTAQTVAWNPNTTLTGANTYTPQAKPSTTTTYTITGTAANGCVSTDNTVITVIPYCVKPMNAFTPNGDGFNDRWLVTSGGACTQQVIAKVFNRYGELVYSNDYYNNDWDGKYKGKPVADGTYYYVLQFRLINGNSIPVKGDVTILR